MTRRLSLLLLLPLLCGCSADWWWTPDQQGRRAFERGDYELASARFEDPLWKGVAAYRAEDYEGATAYFARDDSADGWFNRGNAQAKLQRYRDAVASYDEALVRRPGWQDAKVNREIVLGILKRQDEQQGEPGDPNLEADDTVVDEQGKQGKAGEVEVDQLATDDLETLWMRRLQTSPAGFLKRKFAIQAGEEGE